jgi:hypothetical protein
MCTVFDQQDSWRHDRQRTAKSCLSIPPKQSQTICLCTLLPLNAVHRDVGVSGIQLDALIERFF